MTDKPSEKNASSGKPSDCPICFESLASEKNSLICGHWVHYECAKKQIRDECPLCRTVLNLKPQITFPIITADMETSSEAEAFSEVENSDDDFEERCEPWRKNGYNYREEDIENYDEENPDGDSVYYD